MIAEIEKTFELVGMIVNRIRTAGGVFNSNIVAVIASLEEIVNVIGNSAIREIRSHSVIASAIDRGISALQLRTLLGCNIENPPRVEAVLGG
jgi:hypothetical protein